MNKLTQFLIKEMLDEPKTVAIYGGGFKPPTKGHFNVAKQTLEDFPEIDELKIFVGGGIRDGITQDESIKIWEIYKKYLSPKVDIEPSVAPVKSILGYAKENPDIKVYWILGAREGDEDDLKDIESRTKSISKYPNLEVKVITSKGGVSGTKTRAAIKAGNKELFSNLIPDVNEEEKEQIWNLVIPVIKEVDNLNEADPEKGTGKKPEGSGRRLYTDEDPKDTVGISFKTKEDIADTLNKASFKSKPHARQSQIINVIHQRVRAAYGKAKDPEVKARLKRGLDYITAKKEASKKKTERLNKLKEFEGDSNPLNLPHIDTWHDAQYKAQDGKTEEAIKLMTKAADEAEKYAKENQDGGVAGEAGYYRGTIAWLKKDYTTVEKYINDKFVKFTGNDEVLKRLLKNKDKSYKEAYNLKEASDPEAGTALPYGSGFAPLKESDPFGLKEFVKEVFKKDWNLKEGMLSLTKYMMDNGMNITPLPKIKVIKDDKENASHLLGKTAYYNPTDKSITLYTLGRHPKDVLRSFSHEMVHHMQNLEGRLNNINTTNTNEDGDLPEIEREAYEKGNMMLRNWEDSIKNV